MWRVTSGTGTPNPARVQSPQFREPGPSTHTRSSSPSRLSDVSRDAQSSIHLGHSSSTPILSPTQPRRPSEVLAPSTEAADHLNGANVPVYYAPAYPANGTDPTRTHESQLKSHPDSWAVVRPHLEEALKPLFDEYPQVRPPPTASPFGELQPSRRKLTSTQSHGSNV